RARQDPRGVHAFGADRSPRRFRRILRARDRAPVSALRTAIVGAGYLGRIHARKHAALPQVELVGICDIDAGAGRAVADDIRTRYFADHRELVGRVDAVTIAATTSAHYDLARFFLEHDVHVLVEKPMTRTAEEAAKLTQLA